MDKLHQHIKSITSISDGPLQKILSKFEEKRVAKREHLLQFGDFSKELFFVLEGCLRTYATDFNGDEHNISFSIEDWWAGDLQSFLNKKKAICSIQALEKSTVLSIDQESWDQLIVKLPEFVSYTQVLFRNKMFSQQNRIVQNLSFTAHARYEYFLREYPDISQRIPQKHIASYLGITPEFLSMLRSKRKARS